MTATTELRAEVAPEPAPSGAARGVWWMLGGLMAIASLSWGAYSVVGLIAHEEYTKTMTFAAADVDSLDVSTDNGSIEVTAATGDQVQVTAHVSDGLQKTKVSQEVVDGVLELRGSCPGFDSQWCDVDYTVELPADRPVVINADNGSVVVRGIDAPLELENDNGRIEFDDVSGDVTVSNDNGRITGTRVSSPVVNAENDNATIELTFVDAPTTVTAQNDNGRIEVVLPDTGEAYRIDAANDNGSIDTSEIRSDSASDRTIQLENDNASIVVRYAN